MGTYTVEELDHMRYDLESITNAGNVQLVKTDETTRKLLVKVVNKKVTDDYFSDSALAINEGTWTEGIITFIKKEEED